MHSIHHSPDVCPLLRAAGMTPFTKRQADVFFPPEYADDFPISMQVGCRVLPCARVPAKRARRSHLAADRRAELFTFTTPS